MLKTLPLFGEREFDEGALRRSALLSDCGLYRYCLTRQWATGPDVCWVMLNPSTADHESDDPTIRKCAGFTRRWGFGALTVVNLFAYRATDPKVLSRSARRGVDVVGPEADRHIARAAERAGRIVAAWGNLEWQEAWPREREVLELLSGFGPVVCFGLTQLCHPRHPVRLPYATPLESCTLAPQRPVAEHDLRA